jgi:hypothetical protein
MSIKESVQKTYKYSSYFDYPLYPEELLKWLVTPEKIRLSEIPPLLIKKISLSDIHKRKLRQSSSEKKKNYSKQKLDLLRFFPFINFVGITGSVSVDNADKNDDIDIFIITSPHTLWVVRPFVLFYLEILGIRRRKKSKSSNVKNLICPNLWLDANNLIIGKERRNLFTAHEVLQVFPLVNKNLTFEKFISKNNWVKKYLANAYHSSLQVPYSSHGNLIISNIIYFILAPLNLIFFALQYLFMLPHRKGEEIGLGKAFFHDPNFQKKLLISLR